MNKLNMRQRKFVDAYIQTGSAKESARLAGYSNNENNLETRGALLLKKERIQKEIDDRYSDIAKKTEDKATDVAQELAGIIDDIRIIAKTAKNDKTRLDALIRLGQRLGEFNDKLVIQKEGEQAYQKLILERFDEAGEERITIEKPVNLEKRETPVTE